MGHEPALLAMPNADLGMGEVGTATRTSSTGRWALASTSASSIWSVYWALDRIDQPVSYVTARRAHVRAVLLSRTVSATTVRIGRSIVVSGRMGPAGMSFALQRYDSGAWRTVSRSTTHRPSYSLIATPPRGSWRYRVVVVGTRDVFGTTSSAFTLRAV